MTKCRHIILDPVRAELICAETGEVLQDRLPYELITMKTTEGEERENLYDNIRNWKKKKKQNKRKKWDWEKVIELYKVGNKPTEIAQKLRIPTATVYRILHKAGLRRKGSRTRPETKAKIIIEYYRGTPVKNLARKYGLTKMSIYRIIRKGEKIIELHRKGYPPLKISLTLGTSVDNVKEIIKAYHERLMMNNKVRNKR